MTCIFQIPKLLLLSMFSPSKRIEQLLLPYVPCQPCQDEAKPSLASFPSQNIFQLNRPSIFTSEINAPSHLSCANHLFALLSKPIAIHQDCPLETLNPSNCKVAALCIFLVSLVTQIDYPPCPFLRSSCGVGGVVQPSFQKSVPAV